ncbi:Hemolysin IA [Tritonibacter multivorans]|uniref:Hemolysin IA n=1 Tax=Tritonibacter multivorans TaxID=928856 RepID=A0A0P1H0E9_9RHOB|nr:spondin domain-containing protein [Tritonibacter multivorans]MDA7420697.1 spondin domain-containing protein [Tritonibacter multivorans]CUH81107.1 Hemolysin IA [Tritonibacter multivorans]SFC28437.1 Hemolysin-type calcium-binding repeat-containing protein [Tritonibacter multivorans]
MTDIRITVTNTSATGGTFLTPFWFAAHDGSFDLYDRGDAASAGLEALAEDGNFAPINAEVTATDADAVTGAVFGAAGPIATEETTTATLSVDGSSAAYLSLAAMILPSNDAFVGTGEALRLFDDQGRFLGAQTVNFEGTDVLDAGTEVNTEEDAAFLNQTAPNTGVDENGVVTLHPGFLPEGEGNILGGTNAFGAVIDPEVADFTQPGAGIADIHINRVETTTGSNRSDFLRGSSADDIIHGEAGRDVLIGRSGYDDLYGGDGRDYLLGGRGNDRLDGGDGRDLLKGGRDNDLLLGGAGNDTLKGGQGQDVLDGGTGRDILKGGRDADVFVFQEGYGRDTVLGFQAGEDYLALSIDGVDDFDTLLEFGRERGNEVRFNFGDGDVLVLKHTSLDALEAENIDFI